MHLQEASAYGVFATLHVAAHQEQAPIPGKDIAESCGIPPDALLAILEKLIQAKILKQEREPPNGFALDKPPEEVTLLQIVEAIDGKQEPDLMLPSHKGSENGGRSYDIPVMKPIGSLATSLLQAHTIQELIRRESGRSSPPSQ